MSPVLLLLSSACIYRVTVEHEPITVTEPFSAVVIDVDAGDVWVVGDPEASGAVGEAELEWHRKRPTLDVSVQSDTLFVRADCNTTFSPCSVDIDLVVPEGVSVQVWSGAGDLSARDLAGPVGLDSGAGDLELSGLSGEVLAQSGAGDIHGSALASDRLEAGTGAGDIDLAVEAPFTWLLADSGAGDIDLLVPSGTYDVQAETGAGDVTLAGVADLSSADRTIRAQTGAGDIRIVGFATSH